MFVACNLGSRFWVFQIENPTKFGCTVKNARPTYVRNVPEYKKLILFRKFWIFALNDLFLTTNHHYNLDVQNDTLQVTHYLTSNTSTKQTNQHSWWWIGGCCSLEQHFGVSILLLRILTTIIESIVQSWSWLNKHSLLFWRVFHKQLLFQVLFLQCQQHTPTSHHQLRNAPSGLFLMQPTTFEFSQTKKSRSIHFDPSSSIIIMHHVL